MHSIDFEKSMYDINPQRRVKINQFMPNLTKIESLNKKLSNALAKNKLPNYYEEPKITKIVAKDQMAVFNTSKLKEPSKHKIKLQKSQIHHTNMHRNNETREIGSKYYKNRSKNLPIVCDRTQTRKGLGRKKLPDCFTIVNSSDSAAKSINI